MPNPVQGGSDVYDGHWNVTRATQKTKSKQHSADDDSEEQTSSDPR